MLVCTVHGHRRHQAIAKVRHYPLWFCVKSYMICTCFSHAYAKLTPAEWHYVNFWGRFYNSLTFLSQAGIKTTLSRNNKSSCDESMHRSNDQSNTNPQWVHRFRSQFDMIWWFAYFECRKSINLKINNCSKFCLYKPVGLHPLRQSRDVRSP